MKINVLTCLFQFPLTGDGITTPRRHLNVSNSTTFDDDGFTSNNIGLTGTAGSRDQFNYGVNVSHQRQDSETTAGTNLTRIRPLQRLMVVTASRPIILRPAEVFPVGL